MPPSRKEDLIEAAVRVFYRQGFHSTGLDVVLQEAGVSRMTLYNHFKSKDELIVAALNRRDSIFKSRMMAFVEANASEPIRRILAVFDFHESWFEGDEFFGCMFINASAEFEDPNCPVRRIAAQHKIDITTYLFEQCELAGISEPRRLADMLSLLIEGAIVTAQVIGKSDVSSARPRDAARRAKETAIILLDAHPATPAS